MKSFSVQMVVRVVQERVVLTLIGMGITGLLPVILPEMIFRTFKYQLISVVDNVSKLQNVLILHGQRTMVVLVGRNLDPFRRMMLSQLMIKLWFVVYCKVPKINNFADRNLLINKVLTS